MQSALISPPRRIPLILRIGIWVSERITGRQMHPARILAWYPKAAIGSGVLEALVAHREPDVDERLLKIVRQLAGAIRAVIIHDQQVEIGNRQGKECGNKLGQIFSFIISRDNRGYFHCDNTC